MSVLIKAQKVTIKSKEMAVIIWVDLFILIYYTAIDKISLELDFRSITKISYLKRIINLCNLIQPNPSRSNLSRPLLTPDKNQAHQGSERKSSNSKNPTMSKISFKHISMPLEETLYHVPFYSIFSQKLLINRRWWKIFQSISHRNHL